MRLFVTVGLEAFPFDRLVAAVDSAVAGQLLDPGTFIQYGSSHVAPTAADGRPYLSYPEMLQRIAGCDAVVAHAGVGTVMACRDLGKMPVLVPRLHRLHEHVDDHQLEFAEALEREGLALVARGEGEALRDQMLELARRAAAGDGPAANTTPGAALAAYLGGALHALNGGGRHR